jgi:hypothetical protein
MAARAAGKYQCYFTCYGASLFHQHYLYNPTAVLA